MHALRASRFAAVTIMLLLGVVSSASAVPYVFTPIDVPATLGGAVGADTTVAQDINNAGNIVGFFTDHGPPVRARGFLLRSGDGFSVIDAPGVSPPTPPNVRTTVTNLNNQGDIVGFFRDVTATPTPGVFRSFVLSGGSFTLFGVPGAVSTQANGINDLGTIAGAFTDASGSHGFLRSSAAAFTSIDVPGAKSTSANDINNNGFLVGFFTNAAGAETAYLRNPGGSITPIIVPGANSAGQTEALGINDLGQIVGVFEDTAGDFHGFLRNLDGTFTTLDAPGSTFSEAIGINNRGVIVGDFGDASGNHGFLATPVAEPATLLLLCAAFAGVVGVGLRRRSRK